MWFEENSDQNISTAKLMRVPAVDWAEQTVIRGVDKQTKGMKTPKHMYRIEDD